MSRVRRNKRGKQSERGIALVAALLVLMLVTAVAAGMVIASNSETEVSASFRDEQTAFFAAKAGVEEIRDRFRTSAPNSLLASLPTNTVAPSNAASVLYVTNPNGSETVAPWQTSGSNYPDNQICASTNLAVTCSGGIPGPSGTWYTAASASSSYAASPVLPWKWARITVKTDRMSSGSTTVVSVDGSATSSQRVCWNGTNEVTTTQAACSAIGYKEVYVITVLAVTPSGSRRMVQGEATTTSLPTLPGSMIFDGSSPTYGAPSSNSFNVNGVDNPQGPNGGTGCGPALPNIPAIGGYDAGSTATLISDVSNPGKYTGAGGSPSVTTVNSQLGNLATVQGLNALVTSVTSAANPSNIYVGNASGLTNPGTNAAPVINVVTGNLTLGGGFSGSGILLVEGTLTLGGNPNYNGLILVIGQGVVVKSGGGNGTVDGSILVANLYNSSGQLITSGAPGSPTINWSGGGNATIQYDSCWSTAMSQWLPFQIVSMREMIY